MTNKLLKHTTELKTKKATIEKITDLLKEYKGKHTFFIQEFTDDIISIAITK